MTLTTHVRVVEPTAVKPIFDYARRLLGAERAAFEHRTHSGPEQPRIRERHKLIRDTLLCFGFVRTRWSFRHRPMRRL